MNIPYITQESYILVVGAFVLAEFLKLSSESGNTLSDNPDRRRSWFWPLVLSILIALWMGDRPPISAYGDTTNYNLIYHRVAADSMAEIIVNINAEWLWQALMIISTRCGFEFNTFLTLVAILYIGTAAWAIKIFCPSSPYLGFLFVVSALFFYSFGINGIRNGLACHIVLLAMANLFEDRRVLAGILAFMALGIHRSTMLPIAGCIAAVTVIKKPIWALYVWGACIVVSLIAGERAMNLLSGIGFDDRLDAYATGFGLSDQFSKTGFRWDFLLFSTPPIYMWWWLTFKKHVRDGWFNALSTTYMLANAFWVLMIRAEFTNRIAYLSWFMFPVLFAYPVCNMQISDSQNRFAALILAGYYLVSFMMLMFVF